MKRLSFILIFLVGCSSYQIPKEPKVIYKGKVCVKRQSKNLVKITYNSKNSALIDIAQSSGILEITTKKSKKGKNYKFFTLNDTNSIKLSWNGRYFGKLPKVGERRCISY